MKRGVRIFKSGVSERCRHSLANSGRQRHEHLFFLLVCITIAPLFFSGCGHFNEASQARQTFEEANNLFNQGDYGASLDKYRQIIGQYPTTADRALFEMGIVYSYPKNEQKDYQKSLESFAKLVKEYPESPFRQNSEAMIFSINNVAIKDKTIAAQQTKIAALQEELRAKERVVDDLQKKLEALEKKVFVYALRKPAVDKILIEKNERRLSLISKGEVLKTYRIALGGNPVGPKERQGDNKTPEGFYVIDSRNRDSRYHCSLHISYPNEKDRKRAREMGVSPGGNIMIHGIKNGYSWIGDAHAEADWTKGCIAVTDEEIEEIDKLVASGTVVEIRP